MRIILPVGCAVMMLFIGCSSANQQIVETTDRQSRIMPGQQMGAQKPEAGGDGFWPSAGKPGAAFRIRYDRAQVHADSALFELKSYSDYEAVTARVYGVDGLRDRFEEAIVFAGPWQSGTIRSFTAYYARPDTSGSIAIIVQATNGALTRDRVFTISVPAD